MMKDQRFEINIGIASYKRPNRLKILLEHLSNVKIPENCQIKILVVDNDAMESAKPVVEEYQVKNIWPTHYLTQAKQNIALARNTILDATTGDYLYFIDDDEYPAEDCIIRLYETAKEFKADVVFGPVLPIYPDSTPSWILQGGFFDRNEHNTGLEKIHGATNNTLIRCEILRRLNLKFNPSFGLSGGEDTDFFYRSNKLGCKMTWCNEAVVYEPVAKERLNVSWLLKRAYRSGQTYAKIYYGPLGLFSKAFILFKRTGILFFAIVYAVFASALGKRHGIKALSKVASCSGQLTGFTKWTLQVYRDPSASNTR